MAAGDLLGRAHRGQVDRRVPGNQQPALTVQRGAQRGCQVERDVLQAVVDRCPELGMELRQIVDRSGQRRTRLRCRGSWPRERRPISGVHARTPPSRCAISAPCDLTFWHHRPFSFPWPSGCPTEFPRSPEPARLPYSDWGAVPVGANQWCRARSVGQRQKHGQPAFPRIAGGVPDLWRKGAGLGPRCGRTGRR